jgi:oligoendopeptidase F
MTLASNQDKKLRTKAAAAFNSILADQLAVAEAELNAILSSKMIEDDLRGFDRPDATRHLSDDIDSSTVDAMLAAVENRFDLPARFYRLKAKLLGQTKLQYHERNVPIGSIDREISYEYSIKIVQEVFAAIDPEFAAIFNRFLSDGQFDVYPAKGKHGGAFCASGIKAHPTYILLNFTGRLRDILTIAHEAGHGINNELQRKAQLALNFGTPLSTAEVASNFMEGFILLKMEENLENDKERLALLMRKLDDDVSSIFRQTAAYRFEQALHSAFRAKGYLSKDEIGRLFQKHMKSYMGSAVIQSPGSENWWVYWSHIRDFFYVYSYASGQLIAKAMQHKTLTEPGFIAKVKEFLSAGTSASPKEIAARLGIDIDDKQFWQTGLQQIEAELAQAEALARKIKFKI